jgi:hypothetical protein
MSVVTRIWIQEIIEFALFFAIALQTVLHEYLTDWEEQYSAEDSFFFRLIPSAV